ncbi:hypothetical protein [Verrucomicrobium spinosum]|uniref:hypothetical protein n=1 Tax=Verrucomicrobium spinosum TaxID=2736 RepID=UPI00017463ED|nr:hypothetical protein [Verrucomicrobium spinosum]
MTTEELQLAALQFQIKQMGPEAEAKIAMAAQAIKTTVKSLGDYGLMGLAVVGCELSALGETSLES